MKTSGNVRSLRTTAKSFLRTAVTVFLSFVTYAANAATLPTRLGDLDQDGLPTVSDLVLLVNYVNGDASVLPSIPGLTVQEREVFLDVNQDGVVNLRDEDALADAILEIRPLPEFAATR